MTTERWQKVKEFFTAAVELETKDRAEFLDKAVGGGGEIRREVEKLLASDADAKTIFNTFSVIAPETIADKIGNYQIIKKSAKAEWARFTSPNARI